MNKGTINQLFQSPATYRIPKLVTLLTASCVLMAMVSLDASASTSGGASTTGVVLVTTTATPPVASATPVYGHLGARASTRTGATTSAAAPPARKKVKTLSVGSILNPFTRTFTGHRKGTTHGSAPTTTTTFTFSATTTLPPVKKTTGSAPVTVPPSTTTTSSPTTTTTAAPTTTTTSPPPTTTTTAAPAQTPNGAYPDGIPDASEPSGMAPPSANALAGYSQSYVTDFSGSSLPSQWDDFSGTPGGDPGAQWASSHVVVSGGVLQLNTTQDPAYNNEWVAGGLCQCGLSKTYGAYFVRSRVTGAGPTQVQLLWPTVGWPPEIDFNETGGNTNATQATVHFGASNGQQHNSVSTDMTQWHTWGVIWSASSITYTLDGKVWGTVTDASEIPNQPMTLDLDQQTWCASGFACPTAPQSELIDWVAEYSAG